MKEKIFTLISLILGVIVIINLSSSIYSLLKKPDLFLEKEERLTELKVKNEDLEAALKRVQSEEFVEKEAREKLNMGRPGEAVVILPKSPEHQNTRTQEQKELPNWKKWYNLFFY